MRASSSRYRDVSPAVAARTASSISPSGRFAGSPLDETIPSRAVDPRLSLALVPSPQRDRPAGQLFFSSSASITMMPLGPRT